MKMIWMKNKYLQWLKRKWLVSGKRVLRQILLNSFPLRKVSNQKETAILLMGQTQMTWIWTSCQ